MTNQRSKLSDLAKRVLIVVRPGARLDWERQDEWQQRAYGYRVCLQYQGRRFTFDFWQGTGIEREPTAADVLDCLLLDATAEGMTFGEWCVEYGYRRSSPKANRTYRKCVEIDRRLRVLLGDDFTEFFEADRD